MLLTQTLTLKCDLLWLLEAFGSFLCAYWYMKRIRGAKEKVDDLERYEESEKYSPKEKAALAYADAITYTDREADEKIW